MEKESKTTKLETIYKNDKKHGEGSNSEVAVSSFANNATFSGNSLGLTLSNDRSLMSLQKGSSVITNFTSSMSDINANLPLEIPEPIPMSALLLSTASETRDLIDKRNSSSKAFFAKIKNRKVGGKSSGISGFVSKLRMSFTSSHQRNKDLTRESSVERNASQILAKTEKLLNKEIKESADGDKDASWKENELGGGEGLYSALISKVKKCIDEKETEIIYGDCSDKGQEQNGNQSGNPNPNNGRIGPISTINGDCADGSLRRYCECATGDDPALIGEIIKDLQCVFEKTFGKKSDVEQKFYGVRDQLRELQDCLQCCESNRKCLEDELMRAQGQLQCTQFALEEEAQRRVGLEELICKLKGQIAKLECTHDCEAKEKDELTNCLKEMECQIKTLLGIIDSLQHERDNLALSCNTIQEYKKANVEQKDRCKELEEALAKCCMANEDLQKEFCKLKKENDTLRCLIEKMQDERRRLLEEIERLKQECAEKICQLEQIIGELKKLIECLTAQNESNCEKMKEIVTAHHNEMDCLRKEADRYKSLYECERMENDRLRRALEDCHEGKRQLLTQLQQQQIQIQQQTILQQFAPAQQQQCFNPSEFISQYMSSIERKECAQQTYEMEFKSVTHEIGKQNVQIAQLEMIKKHLEEKCEILTNEKRGVERQVKEKEALLVSSAESSTKEITKVQFELSERERRIQTLESSLAEAEDNLRRADRKISELAEKEKLLISQESKVAIIQNNLKATELEKNKYVEKVKSLDHNCNIYQGKVQAIQEEKNTLEAQLENANEELKKLQRTSEEERVTRELFQRELKDAQGYWESEVKAKGILAEKLANYERKDFESRSKQDTIELDTLRDRYKELKLELKNEKEIVSRLKAKMDTYREKCRSAREQVHEMLSEPFRQKILSDQQKTELENIIDKLQAEKVALFQQLEETARDKRKLEKKLSSLEEEMKRKVLVDPHFLDDLNRMKEHLEMELLALKTAMNERFVDKIEMEKLKLLFHRRLSQMKEEYEKENAQNLQNKTSELQLVIEQLAKNRSDTNTNRTESVSELKKTYKDQTKLLKDDIGNLKSLISSRDEEIETLRSSLSIFKNKYSKEAQFKEDLIKKLQNLSANNSQSQLRFDLNTNANS